jgi:hypothetical protein
VIDDLLSFIGQAGKDSQPVAVGGLEGKTHILERQRQRELGRELALGDPLQLGCLPRGHQRASAKSVHHRLGLEPKPTSKYTDVATASAANATKVLFTSFSPDPAPTAPTQIVR